MKDLLAIEGQLSRILSFFPRVDAKMAGLFAVNSALVTISALNVGPSDLERWYISVPAAMLLVLISASYYFLYKCNFPSLDGGGNSLIYFKTIQARTQASYVRDLENASDDEYRNDLVEQIWQNSYILYQKYNAISNAIKLTAAALLPFGIFLTATAVVNSRLPTLQN